MAERLAYDIARDLREPGPWPSLKLMTEAADKLEDIVDLLAAAETARDRHQAERDAARQALWDIYAVLGFDTDGMPTPPLDSAMSRSLVDLVTAAAHEYRERCEAEHDAATPTQGTRTAWTQWGVRYPKHPGVIRPGIDWTTDREQAEKWAQTGAMTWPDSGPWTVVSREWTETTGG